MSPVIGAYVIAALLVAVVFVVAFLIGYALRAASDGTRLFLNLIGLVIVAIAVLENAGWSVRPWTAGSPAAAFNDTLFRILLLVGVGFLFVSWTIALANREPR
ncbi:MAG: hypothetical protein JOZ32_12325 [Bryobacterales bacterium]|nr:hypothetical protein [Bryobacterales bacterium]